MDKKEDNMTISGFPAAKSLALLIDPDKAGEESLDKILTVAGECSTDYIFTGGSITFSGIDDVIGKIRERCNIPVILFPGNLLQLTRNADRILLLSLISGRNPELLIGNHVLAAPYLKDIREKITSVGYILINCGGKTSVEYMSQTESIPADKTEIVVATAIAGEMLGLGMIYLEGGSGASNPVPVDIITAVRKNISIPIAVGGGIRTSDEVRQAYKAGADLVVLGNGCEKRPEFLKEAARVRDALRKDLH
jgi:geranylgeranylglyceryl phosphate synthase family protein